MPVVELLVVHVDPGDADLRRQRARAPVQRELVGRAAVDLDPAPHSTRPPSGLPASTRLVWRWRIIGLRGLHHDAAMAWEDAADSRETPRNLLRPTVSTTPMRSITAGARSLVCVALATSLSCRTPTVTTTPAPVATTPPAAPATAAPSGRTQIAFDADDTTGHLQVGTADVRTSTAPAKVTDLSSAETAALVARMEPLPDLHNAPAPVLRAPSANPPAPGAVQPVAFVVPTGRAVTDSPIATGTYVAPLPPPQITPQGEVRAESTITVRFSEPMVEVAKLGSSAPPPVAIAPAVAGSWRWTDTRVAELTSREPRLPQATEFTVTVKPGIRAISGARLDTATSAKFSTPPLAIKTGWPSRTIRPDSPIVVVFDQDIDATKVLPFLKLTRTIGKRHVPVPFTTTTLDAARPLWLRNPSLDLAQLSTRVGHLDRSIVLAPKTAWPAGTELQVVLKPGAPSAEGPRLSTRESYTTWDVAPAFRLRGIDCDNRDKPILNGSKCSAHGYATIEFSNAIQESTYRASKVQIAGEPFHDHDLRGNSVDLWTPDPVGRTYRVAIGDGLVDVYGQPLVGARSTSFVTSPRRYWSYLEAPTGMHVLDPRFEIPQWVVHTQAVRSIHVQLYKVQPRDYFAYAAVERQGTGRLPGKKILDKTYAIGARWGANLRVDLRPALDAAGFGHVIAVATAVPPRGNRKIERQLAWIQVTHLGLQARLDGQHVNAWALDVTPHDRFLAPRKDVNASLIVDGTEVSTATTDASGHAELELAPPPPPPAKGARPRDNRALLQLWSNGDVAFAEIDRAYRTVRVENARWYVTDDRFTYKPGEKAYIKGWVRWTNNLPNPGLAMPHPGDRVTYSLIDSRGVKLASGTLALTAHGGFSAELALPATANLGRASLHLETRGQIYFHPLSIQEFRKPAYAVSLDDDVGFSGSRPLILGENIEMTASAHYYAGGGLPGAKIDWEATLTSATYEPPGWSTYEFDPPRPRHDRAYYYYYRGDETSVSSSQAGSLSGTSSASVVYGIAGLPQHHPSVLTVDATVTDVDRMTIRASSRKILVHPSAYYVGLRLQPEQPNTLQAIVTDIDGKAVAGVPVEIAIEGVLGSERFRNDAKVIDRQSCKLTSGDAPVSCPFKRMNLETAYTARATVADARGRSNTSEFQIPWWVWDTSRDLSIIPDKPSYRPGEIATLTIHSKVLPATAIVTFARQGVITQNRVDLTSETTKVKLPIELAYIKNVHVQVDRFAKRRHVTPNSKLPLPESVSEQISIPVDVESARLDVRATPSAKLVEPGAEATFDVDVSRLGKPAAGAEVALIVVDEAILALSGRSHEDPLAPFYRDVGAGTSKTSTLDLVHDSGPDLAGIPGFERYDLDALGLGRYGTIGHGFGSGSGYGAGGAGMAGLSSSIVKSRKDFRPTAVFSPTLITDANGHASVTVKMPESLTRFRIVALAAHDKTFFGKGESSIVTQRKINARTVAPRFLSQGDEFDLPVVVQNLAHRPRTVEIAVRAANLKAIGATGKRVTVPAGQRAEVRFSFATEARGRAAVQTLIASGAFADGSTVELPVYEPATTEAFATYGIVDDKPQAERLAIPTDVFRDVGGLEIEVSSTQLASLTDAYWYLYAYPYECAEQRSGRMLATTALSDILDAFATPGRPTRDDIQKQHGLDLEILAKTQNADGGWGYFRRMQSNDLVSMQVLQAIADHAGTMRGRAEAFVTRRSNQLIAKLAKDAALPIIDRKLRDQTPSVVTLAAMSLTSLASVGRDVKPRAMRLHTLATKLGVYPVEAEARVLSLLAKYPRAKAIRATLLRTLLSSIHETAKKATVTTSYIESERLLLASSVRTDALALAALIEEAPEQPVIAKLARGVLAGRRHGRWMSTQDNLFALQAMRHYFDRYEKATPNYTGKMWLGTSGYAEQPFVGRSTKRGVVRASWNQLAPGTSHDLAFVKDGAGRMYYRVGITYAPSKVDLPALDAGFIVRRSYTAAGDPGDVVKRPDGSYRIKLGAKVLVTVEAVNTTARHAVALVDPMPAGFESVNTALATSERAVKTVGDTYWDFINMRDNRSEAFEMSLPVGHHQFSYTVRATTPGRFRAAPAKAEEMYAPETFGRSTGTVVVIE